MRFARLPFVFLACVTAGAARPAPSLDRDITCIDVAASTSQSPDAKSQAGQAAMMIFYLGRLSVSGVKPHDVQAQVDKAVASGKAPSPATIRRCIATMDAFMKRVRAVGAQDWDAQMRKIRPQ